MLLDSSKWRLCFLLRVITVLIISTWCSGMCPAMRRSRASRSASVIPKGEGEKAFQEAAGRIQNRNEHERILRNERIKMDEKFGSQKMAYHKEKDPSVDFQNARKELVFQETDDILAERLTAEEVQRGLEALVQRQDSTDGEEQNTPCKDNAQYREIDGSCNHLPHPKFGTPNSCYKRLLQAPSCDDPPVQTNECAELPGPRHISTKLFSDPNCLESKIINTLYVPLSQFVIHDMIQSAEPSEDVQCCQSPPSENSQQCIDIPIPDNDPFYNISCMNMERSKKCPEVEEVGCSTINEQTSYMDLSHMYGTDAETTKKLRRNDGSGKLRSQNTSHGELLPNCSDSDSSDSCEVCYETADSRSNQHLLLELMHVLFMREHNRFAEKLKELNPHWDDEKIFQEAKKINNAIYQKIIYNEYLTITLGSVYMERYDLSINPGERTVCDNDTDPQMYDESVTAGLRYAHYVLPSRICEDCQGNPHFLRDTFFCSESLQKGALDDLLRGAISRPATQFDCCIVSDVRNFLYRRGNEPGRDLAAIDIQRGRDHALQPYNKYVKYCLGIDIRTFDDLVSSGLMTKESALYLQCTYRDVNNVEVFPALCFEEPVEGGIVGPVAACMIAKQFNATKRGDCHWFQDRNNGNNNASFSDEQLASIMKYSGATFLCHTSGLKDVPREIMKLLGPNNPMVSCDDLDDLDFLLWKEEPVDS